MIAGRPLVAFIPTLGRSNMLGPLLDTLAVDRTVDEIIVADNRPQPSTYPGRASNRVTQWERPRPVWSLYAMWNEALAYAASRGALLALLNDDIRLEAGWLDCLAGLLLANGGTVIGFDPQAAVGKPEQLTVAECDGTLRRGGIHFAAVVVDAPRSPLVEEGFLVWYGDDSLAFLVREAGGTILKAVGWGVDHATSTTVNSEPWTGEAINADRRRWEATGRP